MIIDCIVEIVQLKTSKKSFLNAYAFRRPRPSWGPLDCLSGLSQVF